MIRVGRESLALTDFRSWPFAAPDGETAAPSHSPNAPRGARPRSTRTSRHDLRCNDKRKRTVLSDLLAHIQQ